MLKIKILSIFFFFTSFVMFSQESLNDYKYIIVPSQYEFQKSEDSYKINSLTKFLFNKAGFKTLLSTDNFPNDLASDRCLALTAKLKKSSSMFSTKMNYDLVTCNNKVVFSSSEASTKEKDYKKAYHEAIRKTFENINAQNYKYTPKEVVEEVAIIKEILEDKSPNLGIIAPKEDSVTLSPTVKVDLDLLYAQPINNGFQLVDSSPKRVYTIQQTSVKNVYILKDKNGILYKHNNEWIAEYYTDNKLVKEKINIKF